MFKSYLDVQSNYFHILKIIKNDLKDKRFFKNKNKLYYRYFLKLS